VTPSVKIKVGINGNTGNMEDMQGTTTDNLLFTLEGNGESMKRKQRLYENWLTIGKNKQEHLESLLLSL
jgi:hypothetical protein